MHMRSSSVPFIIAGVTLVLCWLLFALFYHNPASQVLFAVGNVIAGMGVLLIVLAMRTLRKKGHPQDDRDFTATTQVVKRGVYAIVRHPLYLGWLLAYPAAMLVAQHWSIVVLGGVGMASVVAIARRADRDLVAKFGPEYENYMEKVPRLNVLWGLVKKISRGR